MWTKLQTGGNGGALHQDEDCRPIKLQVSCRQQMTKRGERSDVQFLQPPFVKLIHASRKTLPFGERRVQYSEKNWLHLLAVITFVRVTLLNDNLIARQ